MVSTDILNELYNPTNDFFLSEYGNQYQYGNPIFNFGGGGGYSGGGAVIYTPSPIITIDIPLTTTPKVNIKLLGLLNGYVNYDGKSYYDSDTIEFNVLSSLDKFTFKPEGAEYQEYYVISFEDVTEEIPVLDPPVLGGGGGMYGGGPSYTGGGYNPDSPAFNSNLAERPIDQRAQK